MSNKGRLNCRMGNSIRGSLLSGKSGRHWEFLVGYSVNQLKKHLERLFSDGMNWENFGEWHIDHKLPLSVFNFETPEDIDFKRAWALKNLQPMWAKDNILKSNKISRPFQPSLKLRECA